MQKETISYRELARRVGDCVLNNNIMNTGDFDFELVGGKDDYCYKHETEEECEKDSENCECESREVYQNYIITPSGADYLIKNTDEIVYYSEKLDMYLWGITHFGTSWDGVFTEINNK